MNRAAACALGLILLSTGMGMPPAAAGESGADPEPLPLIDFRIEDQFGKLHTSGALRNSVAVVISGDRKGHMFMEEWSRALEDSLATQRKSYRVKIVQHAHLKGVPFFIKGKVKGSFSDNPEKWVLMDWGGEFAKAYDLTADHCSIVVFDQGAVRRMQVAVEEFDPEVFTFLLTGIRVLAD